MHLGKWPACLRAANTTYVFDYSLTIECPLLQECMEALTGVCKRNSSRHLFSSALFKEIPTVEPELVPVSGDCVGTEISPRRGVRGESLLRSMKQWIWGFEGLP